MLKSLGLDMPAAKAKDQNGQDAVGECQDENWNVWSQKVSNQEKFHLWFLIKIKPAGKSALQWCKTNYVNFTFAHTLSFNNSRKQHFGNLKGFRREHVYPLVWTSQNPKVMRDFFCEVCFAKTLKKIWEGHGSLLFNLVEIYNLLVYQLWSQFGKMDQGSAPSCPFLIISWL